MPLSEPHLKPTPKPTPEDFAFSRLTAYSAYQWAGYRDPGHVRLIARELEAVERGENDRLMVFLPPRHGKSHTASENFPAWYLGRNPDHYVIAASHTQELADDFGRKVRNQIVDPVFRQIFPGVKIKADSTAAKRFHVEGNPMDSFSTGQNGAYFAVGVGGPLTGRGAHLLLIDDPIKNREDADSETIRKKIKDWYTSTAYTRLMPGGRIVIIQCMTGDTPVLMADGNEKALRDVRRGDTVATYENGRISTAKVLNWALQGSDQTYEIRTISGTTVRANERHPFLVERDGKQEWIRLRDLKIGDAMLRAKGRGSARLAPTKDATAGQKPRATATITTRRSNGPADTAHHQPLTLSGAETSSYGIDTESGPPNTTRCLPNKAASVPFVSGKLLKDRPIIGAKHSALTTVTILERSEDCSATTATLSLGADATSPSLSELSAIYSIDRDCIQSILPSGREDVFDIQVERTENFIANGLISHNTRWHEDDLAGWLLKEHAHENWRVIDLPAISDAGKPLWPEQYPIEVLERIRRAVGPRDWSALYQQKPRPDEGDYFKAEWLRTVDKLPPRATMKVYGASDYAVTKDGGDFTVHVVVGMDPEGRLYLLDLWRAQTASDKWVQAFCDLVLKWRPIGWAEETGQIKSGVGPFLEQEMRKRNARVAREQFPTRGDKAIRAQGIRGRMAMDGLYIQRDVPWRADLLAELLSFPVGVHDDQADALGLIGQILDRMQKGKPADAPNGSVVPKGIADMTYDQALDRLTPQTGIGRI